MRLLTLIAALLFASLLSAQSDSDVKAEEAHAQSLYAAQNFTAAVPLYEDLHKRQPANLIYTEHLAMSLLGSSSTLPADRQRAQQKHARELLLQAQAAGDNSNLLQVLLEKTADLDAPPAPAPAGHEFVAQGEAAFGRGDLAGALEQYKKAYDVNPQYYAAALFAGDTEYKRNHPREAGEWFAKAVAIDPNQETAWRYWGDCLEKAGEHKEAEARFLEAIVAQPYQRSPRVALKQWGDANHAMISAPPIRLPAFAEPDASGNININLDPATLSEPSGSAWVLYPAFPQVWREKEFAKHFPNEKTYRHSLPEQAEALRAVLAIARENKIKFDTLKDPTLRLLDELDKAGLLESYILLDHPNQGIANDYVAYRAHHRDLLLKYLATYYVHPM